MSVAGLRGLVLGVALLAQAPDAVAAEYWEDVYRRGTAVAVAGGVTGAAGVTLTMAGIASGDGNTATMGVLAFLVGAPIMAGGSLRARRALRMLRLPVTPVPGYIAWGLWGGGMALALVPDVDSTNLAGLLLGMVFGAYSAAGLQMVLNAQAWHDDRSAPPRPPPRTFEVHLAPAPGGLVVSGRW